MAEVPLTRIILIFHRWERNEAMALWRCEEPPDPKGPSYGKQPNVCLGCGVELTDEDVCSLLDDAPYGRLELDLALLVRQQQRV